LHSANCGGSAQPCVAGQQRFWAGGGKGPALALICKLL
jgi:hypothetical protein